MHILFFWELRAGVPKENNNQRGSHSQNTIANNKEQIEARHYS
jgi:hypothetical protein